MSDFEDQIMRDRLQRLGGRLPDEDAAYAALQQRVRAAKRRRAVVGSGGLAAACVLALVVSNLPSRNHQSVTTATDGVTDASVSAPTTNSTTTPDNAPAITPAATPATTPASTPASTPAAMPTTTPTTGPADTTITKESSVPSVVQPTAPPSGASTGTPAGNGPSSSTAGTQGTTAPTTSPAPSVPETEPTDTGPSTPPAPSVDETRTFVAAHGSITVHLNNGQLTLVDQHADDGYTFQLDRNDPDRIRVRLRSDQATSQIDVFISGGHIDGTIEEQSSSPAGVAPATTDDSTSGGPGHN